MKALAHQDLFAGEVAELALSAPDIEGFRRDYLALMGRRFAIDIGITFASSDGMHFAVSDTEGEAGTLQARLPRYLGEFSGSEWAHALVPRSVSDEEVIGIGRRDQLALYREFLASRRVRGYVLRMWLDGKALYGYVFNCCSRSGWTQFAESAATQLNAAFPVLALAEKLHRLQSQAPCGYALSRDLTSAFGVSRGEHAVLELLIRGLTNSEIATILGLSANTVRNQVASTFKKLRVSRRSEAVYVLAQARPNGDLLERRQPTWFSGLSRAITRDSQRRD